MTQAQMLQPVGAIASSTYTAGGADRGAIHLIDDSGINEVTQTHDADTAEGKMWMAAGAIPQNGASVRFNLGDAYHVEEMKIWNFNWSGYTGRGVKGYDVLVSTNAADPGTAFDDPAKWTLLHSGLTLPQATGTSSYTGEAPVTIGVTAHWLAIRIFSSISGGNEVGLSEVRFYGALPWLSAISPPPLVRGTGGETNNMTFTLSILPPEASDIQVAYATSNMTAIAGTDYVAVSGVATIAAGQTSTAVNVPIIGTDFAGADTMFALWLEALPGELVLPGRGWMRGTILNNRLHVAGQPLRAVAAIASSRASAARDEAFLINGAGLDEATQAHDADAADNKVWMSNNLTGNSVRFNFGGIFHLERMKIWNLNWNPYMDRGVKDYDVLVSTNAADPGMDFDDPAKWTLLHSGLTLPQASGLATYTGEKPVEVNADAHWLAIRILSNRNPSQRPGLSEVRFWSTPAEGTEPAAQAVASSTFGAGATFRSAHNLINLSGFDEAAQTHAADTAVNKMWMAAGASGQSVRFNFARVRDIKEMRLWNFNWAGNTSCGVKDYDVLVSVEKADPGDDFGNPAKWTVLHSGLTLPEATGLDSYTGEAPVAIGAKAHWLAIRILSTHGAGLNPGLSEVRFYPDTRRRGTMIIAK